MRKKKKKKPTTTKKSNDGYTSHFKVSESASRDGEFHHFMDLYNNSQLSSPFRKIFNAYTLYLTNYHYFSTPVSRTVRQSVVVALPSHLAGERTSKQNLRSRSGCGRMVHSLRSSSIIVRLSLDRFRYTSWLSVMLNQRLVNRKK